MIQTLAWTGAHLPTAVLAKSATAASASRNRPAKTNVFMEARLVKATNTKFAVTSIQILVLNGAKLHLVHMARSVLTDNAPRRHQHAKTNVLPPDKDNAPAAVTRFAETTTLIHASNGAKSHLAHTDKSATADTAQQPARMIASTAHEDAQVMVTKSAATSTPTIAPNGAKSHLAPTAKSVQTDCAFNVIRSSNNKSVVLQNINLYNP